MKLFSWKVGLLSMNMHKNLDIDYLLNLLKGIKISPGHHFIEDQFISGLTIEVDKSFPLAFNLIWHLKGSIETIKIEGKVNYDT